MLVAHKTKGLRIATRCTTMDQFVAAFHRFVDAQTVFISTLNPRSIGLETAFSIDLADNTPALRGLGVVLESWTTPQNPYGRPGLQLGIRKLTPDSEPVLDRLLFAREATTTTPTPLPSLMPVIIVNGSPSARLRTKPGISRPLAPTLPQPLGAKQTPPPLTPKAPLEPIVAAPPADPERTPGSELVLPANPLMNIDDKSLEGFVDCTLYEETGNFFGEQPVVEDPEDPAIAPPLLAPRRTSQQMAVAIAPRVDTVATVPVINKLTPPMGASAHVAPSQFTLPMAFGKNVGPPNRVIPLETLNTATQIAQQMQTPLQQPAPSIPPGPPPIPGKPWISPETAEMLDLEPDVSGAGPMPVAPREEQAYVDQTYPSYDQRTHASDRFATVQPQAQPHISQQFQAYRAPAKPWSRRTWVIGGSAVATVVIAFALVMASKSSSASSASASDKTAPVASKLVAINTQQHHPVAESAPVPNPPVADAPAPNGIDEPAVDETTATTTNSVIGKGPCKIAISTTPAGSMISVDGEQLGPSPLTVAGPCAKRHVAIVHPRYASVDRFVTPKADDTLDITLMRPTHNLFVETQPAGATVSIDGHRAGTSPTMVKVMGFTTLTLEISKPGWKPTTKKLYSKAAVDRMAVKLTH